MKQASSSSSCNSTSLTNRLKTIFKKAYELSVLCAIEVCVIYYGPDGGLKTWPEERERVKDMALRYKEAIKRKKSLNLHKFLEEKDKDKVDTNLKKKQKKNLSYPNFDHYSPQQLSQLIQSLERSLSKLQERLRFVEAQKQRNTNIVHPDQPLNPSKFSLYVYNHEDATLSQLPLTASHLNQLANYQNCSMKQEPYGFDQNMCMDNMITNTNFQHPCVSTTQDYSPLLPVQATEGNNYGWKSNLMQQQELYDSYHNVPQHPHLSNAVPHELSSDYQMIPYGDMVGNSSFSQDRFSNFDTSTLPQTSYVPSLHTIPNSYCLPDNKRLS